MTVKVSKSPAFQLQRVHTGSGSFPNRSRNNFLAFSQLNVMAKDTIEAILQLLKSWYLIFVDVIEIK